MSMNMNMNLNARPIAMSLNGSAGATSNKRPAHLLDIGITAPGHVISRDGHFVTPFPTPRALPPMTVSPTTRAVSDQQELDKFDKHFGEFVFAREQHK